MTHPDDAFAFIVKEIRAGTLGDQLGKFDVDIEYAIVRYLTQAEPPFNRGAGGSWGRHATTVERIWPLFADAAHELVRRGVMRPGPRGQADGSAKKGFVVTHFGKEWLKQVDNEMLAITLPGRFEQLVSPFATRFGDGFIARAREAVKAYHAGLYLACCTMCGASSESILLQLAIAEMTEANALEVYDLRGRNALKAEFLKSKNKYVREGFERHFNILGSARDDAAHGKVSQLKEQDAFLAPLALFRLAQFSEKEF